MSALPAFRFTSLSLAIYELGLKNQRLIGRYLDHGLLKEAKQLRQIDTQLSLILIHQKMLGHGARYIWRTQDDDKVRSSHAINDNKIFDWDNPPPTGHPGEDYGCRCWAEPLGDSLYARQTLITQVDDNPDNWGNADFTRHYRMGKGKPITLGQAGYLNVVIEHFANKVITSDGSKGGYQAVERQIIERAIETGEGPVKYGFRSVYPFGNLLHLLTGNGRYSLGHSRIIGSFQGAAHKKGTYLIISGIMTYKYEDEFTDPSSKVESLMKEEGISRAEAVARLGDSVDTYGIPYDIEDFWQTKVNATVKISP